MKILAIDPGPEQSAFVVLDLERRIAEFGTLANLDMRDRIRQVRADEQTTLVVEMIASYGMSVGAEIFDTCLWIGRFLETWGANHALMFRREVKLHLCASARAKDTNIRQALIDRFGPGKERAIGTKKNPGSLYGIAKDEWAALAVGVTYADQQIQSGGAYEVPPLWNDSHGKELTQDSTRHLRSNALPPLSRRQAATLSFTAP